MDPQATWEQLLAAYAACDWDQIEDSATALLQWLDRDGFPPRIIGQPGLALDWDRALARAGCLFALELTQCEWRITP